MSVHTVNTCYICLITVNKIENGVGWTVKIVSKDPKKSHFNKNHFIRLKITLLNEISGNNHSSLRSSAAGGE
jgi:hypothetical protein